MSVTFCLTPINYLRTYSDNTDQTLLILGRQIVEPARKLLIQTENRSACSEGAPFAGYGFLLFAEN